MSDKIYFSDISDPQKPPKVISFKFKSPEDATKYAYYLNAVIKDSGLDEAFDKLKQALDSIEMITGQVIELNFKDKEL